MGKVSGLLDGETQLEAIDYNVTDGKFYGFASGNDGGGVRGRVSAGHKPARRQRWPAVKSPSSSQTSTTSTSNRRERTTYTSRPPTGAIA